MILLALDLSKRSTGWALWSQAWDKPRFGHWCLGSEFSSEGAVFLKLHRCLNDLRQLARFEWIYHEEAINPANLGGRTNIAALRLAGGLAAHVESFAEARQCKVRRVNVGSWRKDFLGYDLVHEANAEARAKRKATGKGSARDKLKALSVARCRQLGLAPANDDEAEAIGILDFACSLRGIIPPWRQDEVLRPPMELAR